MSTSPSSSSDDDLGAPSRSTIVGRTETWHHLLDIKEYSYSKKLPTGNYISCPFTAGGHSWAIHYYPKGRNSSYAAFISVYLGLNKGVAANAVAEPVKALAKFSLLDQAGKPVPSHTHTTGQFDFSSESRGYLSYHDFIDRAWLEDSEHLKDDSFTIRCDIVVTTELRVEETRAAAPFVVVPPLDLHRHVGDLLVSKHGADVTFQVAGETFSALRYVLAARSKVFKAELFGPMKEGASIRVDDMEARVFRVLLGFVYTDTLPDDLGMDQQEEAAMAQHLLVAADRYNLERLKLICEEKLCKLINRDSAATHHCRGLKEACIQFLGFPLNLSGVKATEGFDHLARSCPSILEEI
uniref:BTB domain-containing protein n=1 Tax=Setaria viridis TaxID=4556 RepID=A0A4U6T1N9_SETVI|nr:hypothetical protein SEVIR_9G246500v2 [Setaria viridis]